MAYPPSNPSREAWEMNQERMISANQKLAKYVRTLSNEAPDQTVVPARTSPT
jgi:hypothetical protein